MSKMAIEVENEAVVYEYIFSKIKESLLLAFLFTVITFESRLTVGSSVTELIMHWVRENVNKTKNIFCLIIAN